MPPSYKPDHVAVHGEMRITAIEGLIVVEGNDPNVRFILTPHEATVLAQMLAHPHFMPRIAAASLRTAIVRARERVGDIRTNSGPSFPPSSEDDEDEERHAQRTDRQAA